VGGGGGRGGKYGENILYDDCTKLLAQDVEMIVVGVLVHRGPMQVRLARRVVRSRICQK